MRETEGPAHIALHFLVTVVHAVTRISLKSAAALGMSVKFPVQVNRFGCKCFFAELLCIIYYFFFSFPPFNRNKETVEAYCSTLYHKCPSRADHEQRYNLLTACSEKVSPPIGFLTEDPPSLTLRGVKTTADLDQVAVHVRLSYGCFTAYQLWMDEKNQLRRKKHRSSGKSPTQTGELLVIGISSSTNSEPASNHERHRPQVSKRQDSSVISAAKKRQSTTGVVELATPAQTNVTEISASVWNMFALAGVLLSRTARPLVERQGLW